MEIEREWERIDLLITELSEEQIGKAKARAMAAMPDFLRGRYEHADPREKGDKLLRGLRSSCRPEKARCKSQFRPILRS